MDPEFFNIIEFRNCKAVRDFSLVWKITELTRDSEIDG